MKTNDEITLRRPDDWHLHLRDGAMLTTVLPYSSRVFARAIIMPNLTPPVTDKAAAAAYRERILAALPKGDRFTPLMTLYLTDGVDVADLKAGHAEGIYTAAKLYPAHATTNSAQGVTAIEKIYPALEAMQAIGMPLLVHGEVTDPNVDVFDREKIFIERTLAMLLQKFPSLKVVLEHVTTREAIDFVLAMQGRHKLAATITPHHLHINRNAIFKGGLRPHFYCLPVAKREEHRLAVVRAATSGASCFFLGTDSAPHAAKTKENACGCAGIFCAPYALEQYVQIFESQDALDRLEAFTSLNGPAFYGLPPNEEKVTLVRNGGRPSGMIPLQAEDHLIPFETEMKTAWTVAR
jgi:dihydroorotase